MSRVSTEDIVKMQSILSAVLEERARAEARNDDMLHQTAAQSEPQQATTETPVDTPVEVVGAVRREGPGEAADRKSPDRVVRDTQVNEGPVHGLSTPKTNGIARQIAPEETDEDETQEAATPTAKETARDNADILSTLHRVRPDTNLEATPDSLKRGTAEEWAFVQPAPRSDISYGPVVQNGDRALLRTLSGGQNLDWSVKLPQPRDHNLEDHQPEDEAVAMAWSHGADQHPLGADPYSMIDDIDDVPDDEEDAAMALSHGAYRHPIVPPRHRKKAMNGPRFPQAPAPSSDSTSGRE
jgi:hypothetical protein